jgi:hypothetical protein
MRMGIRQAPETDRVRGHPELRVDEYAGSHIYNPIEALGLER